MKPIIDAIKKTRAARDLGVFANEYVWKAGEVYASDGKMAAAIPAPIIGSMDRLVPGDELEMLVGRLDGEIGLTFDDESITLRSGSMRGRIYTRKTDNIAMLRPEHPWAPPPPGLIGAMRVARPFVADAAAQPFATCLGLRDGRILASANISVVEVKVPGLVVGDSDLLLPSWAADFVLGADGDLTDIVLQPGYAAFRWESGLWFRTQLMSGSFPATIDRLLSDVAPEQPVKMDPEWKKAYRAVSGISESIITVEPRKVVGGRGRSRVEHETGDSGVISAVHLNPKYFDAVVDSATAWDPNIYPKPLQFVGPGCRGLIIGRRE